MPSAYWVGVPGTWGTRSDQNRWEFPTSILSTHLRSFGLEPYPHPNGSFHWSGDIDGGLADFLFRSGRHSDWIAGGRALVYYLQDVPVKDRNLIAHSHGLQVVLYACALGLQINSLVSIGSPVRSDMMEVARRARPHIGYWTCVHSDRSDLWQWFGEWFDGPLGVVRRHPLCDRSIQIPGVGHSRILHDVQPFLPEWGSMMAPALEVQGLGKLPYGQ
jgi:hypothetical protein